MKKITTINTLLVFLVIIGTIFANLSTVVSIMPKHEMQMIKSKVENQVVDDIDNDFGYELVLQIDTYFRREADFNKIKISTSVYSTGILFEIDNSLIIIGHGYYDSNNQYYIADYSANRISQMAENKEFVALLACYSDNIDLVNELTLTYEGKIDLKSAVNELIKILDWNQNSKFIPIKNIRLFDLDPGGGGGPVLSRHYQNGICYAYTGADDGHYWNLNTQAGFYGAGNWLMSHKGYIAEVYVSDYYYEKIGENTYNLVFSETTYITKVTTKSDTLDYLNMDDIVINGESINDHYETKINGLIIVLDNDQILAGIVITAVFALVSTLVTVGATLLKVGLAPVVKEISVTLAAAEAANLGLVAGTYTYTYTTIASLTMTLIGVTLLVIAVLIIAGAIIFGMYYLQN